jgi:hypothetical protein
MRIIRINNNHIVISSENIPEQEYLEDAIGWAKINTLKAVICKLQGYEVEDSNHIFPTTTRGISGIDKDGKLSWNL